MKFCVRSLTLLLASTAAVNAQADELALRSIGNELSNTSSWDVGYESVIVKPMFTEESITMDDDDITRIYQFNWDMNYGSRLWVGQSYSNGTGWRATWFNLEAQHTNVVSESLGMDLESHFDNDEGDLDIFVDGSLVARNRLQIHAIDLEAFRSVQFGTFDLSLFGGLRYGHIDRDLRLTETNGSEFIFADHRFDGVGTTFGIAYQQPAFADGLQLFSSTRGSLLFGKESTVLEGENGIGSDYNDVRANYSLKPVFETQIGLQAQRDWAGRLFTLRSGMEAQAWVHGGGWDFTTDDGGPAYPAEAGSFGLFGVFCGLEVAL